MMARFKVTLDINENDLSSIYDAVCYARKKMGDLVIVKGDNGPVYCCVESRP